MPELVPVTFAVNTFEEAHGRQQPIAGVVSGLTVAGREPIEWENVVPEWMADVQARLPAQMADNIAAFAALRMPTPETGPFIHRRNCISFAMAAAGFIPPDFAPEEYDYLFKAPLVIPEGSGTTLDDNQWQDLAAGEIYGFMHPSWGLVHAGIGLGLPGRHLQIDIRQGDMTVARTPDVMRVRLPDGELYQRYVQVVHLSALVLPGKWESEQE